VPEVDDEAGDDDVLLDAAGDLGRVLVRR